MREVKLKETFFNSLISLSVHVKMPAFFISFNTDIAELKKKPPIIGALMFLVSSNLRKYQSCYSGKLNYSDLKLLNIPFVFCTLMG